MRRDVSFTVGPEDAGERLDTYLQRRLRAVSRAQIQAIIAADLKPVTLKASSLVREGLVFTITRDVIEEPPPPVLRIVYEDDALVVIDKPGDLAVHPAGRHHLYTVTSALACAYAIRPDPAHRIDRETSGLLVCGRGKAASRVLKQAFAEGAVRKTYLAVVEGWPTSERFGVELPLQLGAGLVRVRMEVGVGKLAETQFELEQRLVDGGGARFALLRCMPKTGRQHQIRAHLAAVDLPLVGDKIYGADETTFIRFTEGRLTEGDHRRLRLPRHALHASRLRFDHPVSGEPLELHSPLPADLAAFLTPLKPV